MSLVEPFTKLGSANRPAPKITVLLGSRWHDPETTASPRCDSSPSSTIHNGRVDVVLGTIAIDGRSRRPRNDGPAPALQCAPDEPVDEGILKCAKRRLAR
jgi:hypothetical protein